ARRRTNAAVHPVRGRQIGEGHGHLARKPKSRTSLIPDSTEDSPYRKAFDLVGKAGYTKRTAELLFEGHRSGDGRATYSLATWYIFGCLFEVNPKKATRLLKVARRRGIAEASFNLARSYEVGFGVNKSPSKALELYIEAAQRGDTPSLDEVIRCV